MFSSVECIWKMTDFDHSWPIKESLVTNRTGGTVGYVAPETVKNGIFSPASDVYSLGQVLRRHYYFYESNGPPFEFMNICFWMIQQDPNCRLSVRQELKRFYDLLMKMPIPFGFEMYGKHLIFPLVAREILFEPEAATENAKSV